MISKISDILSQFLEHEATRLKAFKLEHAPSIGAMYEGLSKSVLEKSIPESLGLQVVDGFAENADGKLSGQIDCMLVEGEGTLIPHTTSYKWPISKILAILEIKKNIYGSELADSFEHLKSIKNSYMEDLDCRSTPSDGIRIDPALRAFSGISGTLAPMYHDAHKLPIEKQILYHTLIVEQVSPLLIVWGYGGYKSEKSLRDGFAKFLETKVMERGYGPMSFPNLLSTGSASLVKFTGQPYRTHISPDQWALMASTKVSTIRILIELLWTKMSTHFDVAMPWGNDQDEEVMCRFIDAQPVVRDGMGGWIYSVTSFNGDSDEESIREWKPAVLDVHQFVVITMLISGKLVSIDDEQFCEHVESAGCTVQQFVGEMLRTGLVALDGRNMVLITVSARCAVLPDGSYVAGEDNTGQLTEYIRRRFGS